MSSINRIANLSPALSQAQPRSAVAVKVLKMAQGSEQMVADMLTRALESVQQSMEDSAHPARTHIDALA